MMQDGTNDDFVIEAISNYPLSYDEPIMPDGATMLILAVKCRREKVITLLLKR